MGYSVLDNASNQDTSVQHLSTEVKSELSLDTKRHLLLVWSGFQLDCSGVSFWETSQRRCKWELALGSQIS